MKVGYYDNVYDSPEKYGLTIVASIHDPLADWSFDDLIVFRHDSGRIFYATDSGCSCPVPFEGYKSIDDLTEVTATTWNEFQTAVEQHAVPYNSNQPDPGAADKTDLLREVSAMVPPKNWYYIHTGVDNDT